MSVPLVNAWFTVGGLNFLQVNGWVRVVQALGKEAAVGCIQALDEGRKKEPGYE